MMFDFLLVYAFRNHLSPMDCSSEDFPRVLSSTEVYQNTAQGQAGEPALATTQRQLTNTNHGNVYSQHLTRSKLTFKEQGKKLP
jgi:hypothetical protein